ncbi:hypothetical protein, partial [Harryflintia acetispora]|uniref:hypothetical protein n=1 Tax=Harryflintia acetispora TaxID=1849041 RepID=UPI001A9AF951
GRRRLPYFEKGAFSAYSVMGFAFSLVCLGFPCSSGTGGTSFFGGLCAGEGRFIPCFAMLITSSIRIFQNFRNITPGKTVDKRFKNCYTNHVF